LIPRQPATVDLSRIRWKNAPRQAGVPGREKIKVVEPEHADGALFPARAGDKLRAARVKAGLDLNDVATRTRVPLRHLQAIESGDHANLPSPTYAIGFAKSYARAIGEDPEAIARDLRDEIGQRQPEMRGQSVEFDDADPSRLPSRTLAWTAAAIALLIAISYGVWRNWLMSDAAMPEPVAQVAEAPKASAPPPAPAANPAGEVVLTARESVWLRIYDAKDKVLFEKEMAAGERFVVPPDADNPMVRTGRAELIAVTVDGREVAPLGPAERTVKDVGISAASLAARPPAEAAPNVADPAAATANSSVQP
jgi:cytoskeleton protein RodZ